MDRIKSKSQYKKMYPSVDKWLNNCIICQSEGYKPELPEKITPGVLAENIRELWNVLEVNELSVCSDCGYNLEKSNN